MARRDFRQLGLADSIVRRRGKKSEWLDRLDGALDWPALETVVAGVYASRKGGLSYPLLTYVCQRVWKSPQFGACNNPHWRIGG